MQNAPKLTDRTALARNRTRANDQFLHVIAREELQDRLSMVNRTFNNAAVVSASQADAVHFGATTHVVDTPTLALDVAAYDLVVHFMALHWADDPVGQLIQAHRALTPDGMFQAVLFGGQTLNELRTCLAEAEARVTGGLSPRIAPMAEIRDLGALLQRGGLALPVADNLTLNTTYASAWHLMRDLRNMGEANALDARLKHPTRKRIFDTCADLYAANFANEDGRIKATFELIFLSGWAPDASQQKPLRPGSAATRLAQALGANETPLKD